MPTWFPAREGASCRVDNKGHCYGTVRWLKGTTSGHCSIVFKDNPSCRDGTPPVIGVNVEIPFVIVVISVNDIFWLAHTCTYKGRGFTKRKRRFRKTVFENSCWYYHYCRSYDVWRNQILLLTPTPFLTYNTNIQYTCALTWMEMQHHLSS